MKKRVAAVIFTGGTIGSRTDAEGWIAPDQECSYALIHLFQKTYPELASQITFDCSMPYQILSENLNAEYMLRLVRTVKQTLDAGRYDSIIICHGSDTIQYSAAVLGLLFPESEIPIYLVASNYPLEDARANGLANYHAAVISHDRNLHGVFVPYRNLDGKVYLHSGTKLLAHRTFEDELYSIHQEYLGYYDAEGNWYENEAPVQAAGNRYEDMELSEIVGALSSISMRIGCESNIQHSSFIQWIRMYPGYSWQEIPAGTAYIMIETYHSGTVCVDEHMTAYLRMAEERKIPVYLVGMDHADGGYETLKQYSSMNVHCLVNVPPITCYCCLWLKCMGLYTA